MFSRSMIFVFITILLSSGCATMNKSECLNADWRMVGMEDGSRGRDLAYIGNHRKACADYNISPDLDLYQSGYDQGIRNYCTYSKALQTGKKGQSYRDICPPDLKADFYLGHQRGRELYALTREIKRTQSFINETSTILDETIEDLHIEEELLISKGLRKAERALLLIRVIEIRNEIGHLEEELNMLEQQKADIAYQRSQLQNRYQAGPG